MQKNIAHEVEAVLAATSVVDMHTHLFAPRFGSLGLSGIDNLLTYHYLEAELFRENPIQPEQYWSLTLTERADLIWKTLFVESVPVSEGTRGVIAVLSALGLDTRAPDLKTYREYFRDQDPQAHIANVFRLAGVRQVVMTNDPLDPAEARFWESAADSDVRFAPALRLDRILNDGAMTDPAEVRAYLTTYVDKMSPLYMAVSLPDTFQYPEDSVRARLLRDAVLPVCREFGLPMALMIGVRRQVNPALKLAGDASGRADLKALEAICRDHPNNRFLVSVLSRENQHELCVLTRKFSNLMLFGCWWFLNNSSVVEEITRERLEMLGLGFIAQNSDARVLEQLIYKWRNTRRTIAPVLASQLEMLASDGRPVTPADIEQAVNRLFKTNFESWISSQ
ncbi:MAG: glucuronate isomerase [Bryobacteraceae bacterium]